MLYQEPKSSQWLLLGWKSHYQFANCWKKWGNPTVEYSLNSLCGLSCSHLKHMRHLSCIFNASFLPMTPKPRGQEICRLLTFPPRWYFPDINREHVPSDVWDHDSNKPSTIFFLFLRILDLCMYQAVTPIRRIIAVWSSKSSTKCIGCLFLKFPTHDFQTVEREGTCLISDLPKWCPRSQTDTCSIRKGNALWITSCKERACWRFKWLLISAWSLHFNMVCWQSEHSACFT